MDSLHEILIRTKDSVQIVFNTDTIFSTESTVCAYSPKGTYMAYVNSEGLTILRDLSPVAVFGSSEIQCISFSPSEDHIITWEKSGVLKIWSISGELVQSINHRKNPKAEWPIVTIGTNYWYLQSGTELLKFVPGAEAQPLALPPISAYSINPKTENTVIFTKSPPQLFFFHDFQQVHCSAVELLGADEAAIRWNANGNIALALCQSEVDTTGRSYYGAYSLYIISERDPAKVVYTTDGPIYDFQWSPSRNEFIEISGFMPAKVTIHIGSKKSMITKNHRNHIRWNRFGDLILVGGFGNLNGDIDIYDRVSCKVVGRCRVDLTVLCEWAPCGRVFVCATMCPRLRVDNGFKIYKYTGEFLIQVPAPNELWELECKFKEFEPKPLTPRTVAAEPAAKKEAYRPPGSTSNFAEKFRQARQNKDLKPAANPVQKPPQPSQDIPGLDPDMLPKKKKKKKKKKDIFESS